MTERKKNLFMLTAAVVIFGTIGVVRSFIPLPSGFIAFVRGILGGGFLLLFMAIIYFLSKRKTNLNQEKLY